jgi:hypothetical protein
MKEQFLPVHPTQNCQCYKKMAVSNTWPILWLWTLLWKWLESLRLSAKAHRRQSCQITMPRYLTGVTPGKGWPLEVVLTRYSLKTHAYPNLVFCWSEFWRRKDWNILNANPPTRYCKQSKQGPFLCLSDIIRTLHTLLLCHAIRTEMGTLYLIADFQSNGPDTVALFISSVLGKRGSYAQVFSSPLTVLLSFPMVWSHRSYLQPVYDYVTGDSAPHC